MAQQEFNYTIVTVHGDLNLSTPYHHAQHPRLEDWLRRNQVTIDRAFGMAGLGVQVLGVYLEHNRKGMKIK